MVLQVLHLSQRSPVSQPKTPARRYVLDRFCSAYFVDSDTRAAAKTAGVTTATACRWLKTPYVKNKLDELAQQQRRRFDWTADSVLCELQRVAEADVPLRGGDKVKALELIGRKFKLWDAGDGEQQATTVNVVINGIIKETGK
jgi:hypothetical protein